VGGVGGDGGCVRCVGGFVSFWGVGGGWGWGGFFFFGVGVGGGGWAGILWVGGGGGGGGGGGVFFFAPFSFLAEWG